MAKINIKDIITRQREFFTSGATKTVDYRIKQLRALKHAVSTSEKEIIDAIQKDFYKPDIEIYTSEIAFVLSEIDYHLNNIRSWVRRKTVPTERINLPARSYYYYEPHGIALIIGTWNYPFGLLFSPLIPAVSAGNCAIVKPSETAPHTSRCIAQLVREHFSSEYIAAVEGGPSEINGIIGQGVNFIFFTGGIKAGRAIIKAAADKLTPVVLELGGKNPCIVDKKVSLHNAVQRIAWGKFFNAGQTCVAPDYCLVHADIQVAFIDRMEKVIHSFYGDNPKESRDYGKIIDRDHFRRLKRLLDSGTVVCGGKSDEEACYISPTVLSGVNWDSPVMQEEIFGPVLPVVAYNEIEEVPLLLREKLAPLAVYCFTEDKKVMKLIREKTISGSICFNGTIHRVMGHSLPFGGVGASGIGRYHGKAGFETFGYQRGVLEKSPRFGFDLIYPPYRMSLHTLKKVFHWLF